MCLAVPMRIVVRREDGTGTVDLDGVSYEADLSLVEDAQPDDFVIVHAGYAIEKLDRAEADARLAEFERLAEIYRERLGGVVRLAPAPGNGRPAQ